MSNKLRYLFILMTLLTSESKSLAAEPAPDVLLQSASDIGIKLVQIHAGTFIMGSPPEEMGRQHTEGPQTKVTLTKDYFLGATDVTQEQYAAVMDPLKKPVKKETAAFPAFASWIDAVAFCKRLTGRERAAGRLPDGYTFSLPTEAQWEYACRAGTTGPYAGDLDAMGWYIKNTGAKLHPVGQKQPNPWGLYDMHGLVWEWCADMWGILPPSAANLQKLRTHGELPGGAVTDPTGWEGTSTLHIVRGGAWNNGATDCRSANRAVRRGDFRGADLGFRLALVVMSKEQIAAEQQEKQAAAESAASQAHFADFQAHLPPAYSTFLAQFATDTGIKLIAIPAGTFLLGEPPSQLTAKLDEGPQTRVTLTKDFFLGAITVTHGQYEALIGFDPSFNYRAGKDAAVEMVSWNDAMAFCKKLTEKERAAGHLLNGYAFTLPTEAQWEYAWRAGTTGPCPRAHAHPMAVPFGKPPGPIGPANAWGICDMYGVVDELCLDWYDLHPGGALTDPAGPVSGTGRVLHLFHAPRVRSAFSQEFTSNRVGFRLALSAVGENRQAAVVQPAAPHGPEIGKPWTVPQLNLEMKYISPGTFTMGSPADEPERLANEGPQIRVTLTKGYWMGATVVTANLMPQLSGAGKTAAAKGFPPAYPSWDGAMEFGRILSEREQAAGRLPRGYVYSLPTEAQWEYACRAGTTGARPGKLDDIAVYANPSLTTALTRDQLMSMQKQPNAWGLYDMIGLASEWCADVYTDTPYPGGAVTDPTGPTPGMLDVFRVFRGATPNLNAATCRSAFRDGSPKDASGAGRFGFRLALRPAVVAPARQAQIDAIVAILRKGPAFSGAYVRGNQYATDLKHRITSEFDASLTWDEQTQMVKGWINYPTLKAKKTVVGSVVDDGASPVCLRLHETGIVEKDPASTALVGITYIFLPDPNAAGHLAGSWKWERMGTEFANTYKGPVTMQPVANQPSGQPSGSRSQGVQPGAVGNWRWVTETKNGTLVLAWVINADGHYRLTSRGPGSMPEEAGRVDFADGNWTLQSDSGRTDQGNYNVRDAYTLSVTGSAGTRIWFRITEAPSSAVTATQPNTVSVPPGMSLIPAGTFTMGDNLDGAQDALATANVKLSAFFMDVNLVSLKQWTPVYSWANKHGYAFDRIISGSSDLPVTNVTWFNAVKWCNARSQQEGLTPVYYLNDELTEVFTKGAKLNPRVNWSANGYRLPTEAEWEWAARGGLSGQRFPWGNTINATLANYFGNTKLTYDSGPDGSNPAFATRGTGVTIPHEPPGPNVVGVFAPNGYGLFDMAGNTEQWCWDWYGMTYAGGRDARGPVSGKIMRANFPFPCSDRVLRGGSYLLSADMARCANRAHADPSSFASNDKGFRCVRGINLPALVIAPPSAEEILRQRQSVRITTSNGLTIYQFLAYPGFWSQAAVAPYREKEPAPLCQITSEDGAQLQMMLDDDVDMDILPNGWYCSSGTRFRFRAGGDKPVLVAVRFLTRAPTNDERVFVMPKYPAADAAPAPMRLALRNAIISLLKKGPGFAGTRQINRANDMVQAELAWDESLAIATGWISYPKQGSKSAVEGRILDDQINQPVLQLVETKALTIGSRRTSRNIVYSLQLSPDGASLTGPAMSHTTPWSAQTSMSGILTISPK